jgi:hypothetical protein
MSTETNRRDALAGAAISGLVASVLTTPVAAQSTGVMATAIEADYKRDPTRWGSADLAAHFPGFKHLDMRTSGAVIRLRHGGSGPPLLLVHGNPENHTCWYKLPRGWPSNITSFFPTCAATATAHFPSRAPTTSISAFARWHAISSRSWNNSDTSAL